MAFASEPDDPDLEIPSGALQDGVAQASELHFQALQAGLSQSGALEPLAAAQAKSPGGWRRWNLSLVISCVFHAAVAATFLYAVNDEVLMEGSDFSGIAYLGDSVDQLKSGEISETEEPAVDVTLVTVLDALPIETVDAEAVPVEAVPVENVPVETVDTVEVAQAYMPSVETLNPVQEQAAEPMEPEAQSRVAPDVLAPEVLSADRVELVDDDNVVQKPAETTVEQPLEAVESVQKPEPARIAQTDAVVVVEPVTSETVKAQEEPVETAAAEKVEVVEARKPVPTPVETAKPIREEKAEAPKEPVKEEKKQATKKTDEGRKTIEKAQAKARKSGNGGQNEIDSRRGQADGQEKGDSRQASSGGSRTGKVGNAAVSNYPGKVHSKLARAARSIRMKKTGEVVVAFSVNASGGVSAARIQSSSGVSEIDQAALQALRKAAPFPPIPENAGRSSWQFFVPLAFSRR